MSITVGASSAQAGPSGRPKASHSASFRPDIEGLRGIAVLLVVLYHAGVPGVSGGFIGVDVFFVLSGYLITGLLLREFAESGRIDFAAFYARRMRRLLPAAALVVLATLLAGAFLLSPMEQRTAARSAFAASTYVSNIQFMIQQGNYFGTALEMDPFLHTWSLAVEEQFYLLWPGLIFGGLALFGRTRRLLIGIAVVCAISLASSVWLTAAGSAWAFFGSPMRAWEFGAGALAAFLPGGRVQRPSHAAALGIAGLALLIAGAVVITPATPFPGYAALMPVAGTTAVLVGFSERRRRIDVVINNALLRGLGRVSYSWYLWHWPFLVIGGALLPEVGLTVRLGLALASLLTSVVAYAFVENPIRFHPRLARSAGVSLAFGLSLTVFGAATGMAALAFAKREAATPRHQLFADAAADLPTNRDCAVWRNGSPANECETLRADGTPTIVVFGDSHAGQWIPALLPLQSQGWRVVGMSRAACPAADVPVENPQRPATFNENCRAWRENSIARIASLAPDLVIVANSREHVTGRLRKDHRRRVSPAEWSEGTARVLASLTAQGTPVMLLRDTPRAPVTIPICLSRAEKQRWLRADDCSTSRDIALDEPVFEAERAAARRFGLVHVADLSEALCDEQRCHASRDGVVTLADADHLTRTFAARLAPEIELHVRTSLARRATTRATP